METKFCDFELPRLLGHYRLMKHLGSGGMGSVFRAVCETTHETVAMKLLRVPPGRAVSPEFLARFRQEAEFLSHARHPNIVQFVDFGTVDREFYIVMEFVEGQTLRAHIQRHGVLNAKDFLDIAVQLADVIHCLQGYGLVHRDLKPQNIMLTADLGMDRVKVLDFGLSTLSPEIQGMSPDDSVMMGTVIYAAPEQTGYIEGRVDARTDLYSLGCVFYEMLVGAPPFVGEDPEHVTFLHLSCPPRNVCELRPELPRPLGAIIAKLLQKNPDERYQTGYGLMHDLKECRRQLGFGASWDMTLGSHDHFHGLHFGSKTIGRDKHFAALAKSVALAKFGNAHAVVITGELGIGKSWFLSDFRVRCIEDRVTFIASRLQKMAFDCGLQPICGMLDTYFLQVLRSSEGRRKRTLRLLAPVLVEYVVPLLQAIPSTKEMLAQILENEIELMEQVSYNIETRRRAHVDTASDPTLSKALKAVVCEISRLEECLVIELDNVHWADADVFRFLDELLASAAGMESRLLVLMSVNRENPVGFEECHRLVHALRQRAVYVHQINLAPFTVDEVLAFVSGIISDPPERLERLAQRLHAFTQGNPLFLREVLKSMAASELLVFDAQEKAWHCAKDDLSELGLPTDAVDLIIERTKPFSAQSRLILAAAARVGLQFTREFLADLFPGWMAPIREALEDATQEHLISGRDGKHWFAHSRIREHFLSSVCEDDAADIHLRILNHIRKSSTDDFISNLREFAHHAYFARRKLDPELVCAACAELALAEDSLGDVQRSHEQLIRALEIASGSRSTLLQDAIPILRIRVAEAMRRLGQTSRALRMLEETQTLIGGRLANSPLDHYFLATVAFIRMKMLQGERPNLAEGQRPLVDIALSLLKSDLDQVEVEADRNEGFELTRVLMALDRLARNGQLFVAATLAGKADAERVPEPRSIEERLRHWLESPHGLTELFLSQENRLSWVVQFLIAAALSENEEDVVSHLERLWESRRDAFLRAQPDFLWAAWLQEFSSSPKPTAIQRIAAEALSEIAHGEGPAALVASLYAHCMALLGEWRRLSTPELHRRLEELKMELHEVRAQGHYYPTVWALLLIAGFKFLFGDWVEVSKAVEDAVAEAEHLDCQGLLDECHAHQAVLVALRDKGRLERCLERMGAATEARRVSLRKVALGLSAFAERPLDAIVESPLEWNAEPSQWVFSHPLMVFSSFLSLSSRIAAAAESRGGSSMSLPALLARLRNEAEILFPESGESGFAAIFKATVLFGTELGGNGDDGLKRQFHAAEAAAAAAGSTTWMILSRLLLFRIKQAEALRRNSQFVSDEAGVHVALAARLCDEAGFHCLGTSLESTCSQAVQTQELTAASVSRTRDLSSLLGRLKLDRVFLYSSSLLGKQSIEELAPAALDAFVELTGAQRGAIFIRDRIATTFFLKGLFGLSHDEQSGAQVVIDSVSDTDHVLPISWSVLMKVRMEGRQIIVHNAQTDDSMANQFSVVKNRIRSVFGIPLTHKDELVGIVYLDSCLLNDLFSRETVKLIQPLIRQVSFSVSNIWLQKSSEESFLALKQSQKTLVQSEKMAGLGQLAASVAHDLRTPLAIVMGLAEDIRELAGEGDAEAVTDSAGRIVNAARKMQRLVQSMQDFARKSSRELQPTSLKKVLDEVLFLTEKRLSTSGVELMLQLPSDLPDIHGNANELEQVFMNLVNNAADAMEASPRRQLNIQAALTSDGIVQVTVRDTGGGISEEHRRQVFQPFFTTKPEGRGTGLGLSIVNTLVQEQGGTITFESVQGQGTSFVLNLPSVDRAGNVRGLKKTSSDGTSSHVAAPPKK